MKILIGYDGSEYGDVILEDLGSAGLSSGIEALILTVADVGEIPTSPFLAGRISNQIERIFGSSDEEIRDKLDKHVELGRAEAQKAAERFKETFSGWTFATESVAGKPAEELIKRADEWKPDLTIVGSHGRSALGRLFLGSVSHKVLHEAHCSVRISRRIKGKDDLTNRILVAVDGSANAEAAVRKVADRKWSENTEIRLVAADDPFNRPEIGYMSWDHESEKPIENEDSKKWIEEVIHKPAKILRSADLQVSNKIVWGDAANSILQEAKEWNANSIFVGARGIGQVRRFLLGSVSSRVATHAKCSVEVVRD
ncbi:MAG: universal stress protein [Pyrinomonadaceae bacterium]|nr:universal stress protein [Pyrinomonadaceae bacterium]